MTALLPPTTITTAVAAGLSSVFQFRKGIPRNLVLSINFTYGSGGTSTDVYVQTSLDGGATWVDIAQVSLTTASATKVYNLSSLTPITTAYTPTSGNLTANTCKDGLIGAQLRVKYVTVGTYAASTTLAVYAQSADVTS